MEGPLSELPLERLNEFGPISSEERSALEQHLGPPIAYSRQRIVRDQGGPPDSLYMLVEGWAASSVTLRTGERQITKVHLPGDLMGMPSICLMESADTLFALSPIIVRRLPARAFAALFTESPVFASRMFLSAQLERVALMDRLVAIGARLAMGRVASMVIDLHHRLGKIGLVRGDEYVLRMTQDEIGDYLGLTSVHVNRMFRQLEDQRLITRRLQRVRLNDVEALSELAGYVKRELDPHCGSLFTR